MYLIPIAWLYVTVLMAVAEATNSNGSVLGAMVTFVLYGALPVTLAVYLMRTPSRRKAIREREAKSVDVSGEPDTGGHATAAAQGDRVAPVRKEK